ncbi:MAG: transposase [Rikenellaceae bacterium]
MSDVKGKSMQKVVRVIINGESDPNVLVELIHKRTINKHGKSIIRDSLSGVISGADRMMLRIAREEMDMYERQVEECYVEMNKICDEHFSEELELLTTIPGVKEDSAVRIIAEIGTDMEAFASSASLVSWAGLRPRNEESAGRIKGRKTLHGNKYLRVLLVQCAWGASRTIASKFFKRYNSLHKRMNHNKALLANARKLLVVIWNILKFKQPYAPLNEVA